MAKQCYLLMAVHMLLCSIRIRWVQCALVFLTDSFPTADFYFMVFPPFAIGVRDAEGVPRGFPLRSLVLYHKVVNL